MKQSIRACPELGIPLAKWVEENIVDLLTERRHTLLREAALELAISPSSPSRRQVDEHRNHVFMQVSNTLHIYPAATIALAALLQIRTHKIDMASLIHTPEELFLSEEEWAGKVFREGRKLHFKESEDTATQVAEFEVEEPERTWMDVDASVQSAAGRDGDNGYELEGPEELNEVMDYVAGVIVSLDRRIREGRHPSIAGVKNERSEVVVGSSCNSELGANTDAVKAGADVGTVEEPVEDPVLRNLRLNLLALAKRAPLDTIARLPKDLVPEHIRQFVPTLGVS
jgi:bromodomain-containing protein 7